ncbi:MAG: class I SAM-dependent methyltransferase [Candidatus Omnitrophica bacterium]|nr:class I SAM-dependent methyltransferase [Candidatus Omnitrophota bacterium]
MTSPAVAQRVNDGALAQWERRVRQIHQCRICGNRQLTPVIDLGRQCLASLFDDGRPENQLTTPIPLAVVRCEPQPNAEGCGFVQLTHTVPPDVLYHDYGYRSGINSTMKHHLQDLVHEIESRVVLAPGDIVLDIGANDGVTLQAYRSPGIVRVGFEPSNIRPDGRVGDLVYIPTVFTPHEFAARFPGRRARVITSIAMFYDIDDPLTFCRGVADLLADDGLWVLELSYLGAMLDHHSFDAICHEHLGYYSLRTLQQVTRGAGFVFHDITFNQANGGSVRCTLSKDRVPTPVPAANQRRIHEALQREIEQGYHEPRAFEEFRSRAEEIRRTLIERLEAVRRDGRTAFGYAASTKGNVLLQYAGVGPEHLVAIADRNPAKVGRLTLGSRIRICSEEEMRQAHPDYLLILAWHFLEEFMEREQSLRADGMRFIVPFPHVRII